MHPNTFHNTINKNVNHSTDTIDNLNQSSFHKPACQCQGHLRTESLSASAHILHCGVKYGLGWCGPASALKIVRQLIFDKSLFILWITGPRSSVRPSLTRAWWLSATGYVAVFEPPPGRGGRQWLGSLPRHSAGVGIPHSHCQVTRSTAILAHSIPSPSSHGSAMARTGRKSLIHTQPNNDLRQSRYLRVAR